MKFKPGYYIIKERWSPLTYHYVWVFVKNGKQYMQIDLQQPFEAELIERKEMDIYEIDVKLSRHRPIQIEDPSIKIEWHDGSRAFSWKVRSFSSLVAAFNHYPRIAKPLG